MAKIRDIAAMPGDGAAIEPTAADPGTELSAFVVTLRAFERVTIDAALLAAYAAASSRHSLQALRSDLAAFDLWCRQAGRFTLPAQPQDVADYLRARAGEGARPASLSR